jgi:hypothetical protein
MRGAPFYRKLALLSLYAGPLRTLKGKLFVQSPGFIGRKFNTVISEGK